MLVQIKIVAQIKSAWVFKLGLIFFVNSIS